MTTFIVRYTYFGEPALLTIEANDEPEVHARLRQANITGVIIATKYTVDWTRAAVHVVVFLATVFLAYTILRVLL